MKKTPTNTITTVQMTCLLHSNLTNKTTLVFHWENRKNDWWALGNFIFKWTIPLSRGRNGSRFISLMHYWCKIRLQALCVIPKIKCSCKMSAANTEKWREMPLSTKHKNKGSRKTKLQQLLLIFSVLVTELPSSFQKKTSSWLI